MDVKVGDKPHGRQYSTIGRVFQFKKYCLPRVRAKEKSPSSFQMMGCKNIPGDVLLSHDLSVIVSSALESLTSVFEMGTGVTPPV
jgi:hypothetical protein